MIALIGFGIDSAIEGLASVVIIWRFAASRRTSFGLPTEPWLFTIDRSGKVAARLEGSLGINGFRDAVEAAL